MKPTRADARMFVPQLMCTAAKRDGLVLVRSPAVGLWRDAPAPGSIVAPGASIGELEILGVSHRLVAPADAHGIVQSRPGPRIARIPVAFDDVLVTLDPHATAVRDPYAASSAGADASAQASLRFFAPLSGRFYARPAPDKPPFVAVGDVITRGQTIALLEVMKTFHRIAYGGDGLPERARVVAILADDEADIDDGDPILDLEPA